MGYDHHNEQHPKSGCGDREKIHGDQIPGVVPEEGFPCLVGASGLRAVLAKSGLADLDSELGRLVANSNGAPDRIVLPHPADELHQITTAPWSSNSWTRPPAPDGSKRRAVPLDHCFGLNNDECALPSSGESYQIAVDGGGGASGEFQLDLTARSRPVNDNLDRKSTRLNSSHVRISYAVFCL